MDIKLSAYLAKISQVDKLNLIYSLHIHYIYIQYIPIYLSNFVSK